MVKHVIIFGFDGLRPDAINPTDTPHLHAALGKSQVMANHRSIYPTETRVNLSSIATGGTADQHNIFANELLVEQLHDGGLLNTGVVSHLNDMELWLGKRLLGLETVGELLGPLGKPVAIMSTGAEGSWKLMAWKSEQFGHFSFNPHAPNLTTPFADLEAIQGKFKLDDTCNNFPQLQMSVFLDHAWPNYKPAVNILWNTETDKASHLFGPGSVEAQSAAHMVDEQLGRLIAWREEQPNGSEIAIIMMSDHGHFSIKGTVSVVDTLRDAGFNAASDFTGNADIGVVSGASTYIWTRDPQSDLLDGVVEALSEHPWFGAAFSPGGAMEGRVKNTLSLSLLRAQSHFSPHLAIAFAGDNEPNAYGLPGHAYADIGYRTYGLGGGYHGGLNAAELTCLFAINCESLSASNFQRYSNTADVLPSVLSLLDVDLPLKGCGTSVIQHSGETADVIEDEHHSYPVYSSSQNRVLKTVQRGDRIFLDGLSV